MENEAEPVEQPAIGLNNEEKTPSWDPKYHTGPDRLFKKGNPGGGRPKGSPDYRTQYRKAIKYLASLNNVSPDTIELEMHANALKRARAGDFAFYRDTLDRVYGKPVQPTDITTGGQPFFTVPKEVAAKNAIKITDPDTLPTPEIEGEGNLEQENNDTDTETVPDSQ